MHRLFQTIGIYLFSFLSLLAQDKPPHCGYDKAVQREMERNPAYKAELEAYGREIRQLVKGTQLRSGVVYRIPVVVHVIHNGDSRGSGSNLSDNRIQSQIDILNEDYRRLNTDANETPSIFRDISGDTEIEFCLARVDPNGNSTNGITRHQYNTINDIDFIEDVIKTNTSWDPLRYLNIWTLDMPEASILGYAFLPTNSRFGTAKDGVVISYNRFGRISNSNRGRTVTHEVGHFLGLRHLWGESDPEGEPIGCESDDGVDDTPTSGKEYFGCPSFPQSSCNSTDMFMNFMDYVNDNCMNLFTTGQTRLMRSILETKRSGLLQNVEATCLIDCIAGYDLNTDALQMGFEDDEPYSCWITEDANNDENTWNIYQDPNNGETGPKSGSNFLAYFWNEDETTAADDYFFSPFFLLKPGHVYELRFSYAAARTNGTTFPEKLEVGFSFLQKSSDFIVVNDEWKFNPVNNGFPNYRTASLFFEINEEANVSLGFHVFSNANQYALQLDDIKILDSDPVATRDKKLAGSYKLYPNPSKGQFIVDIQLESPQKEVLIEIHDLLGRPLRQQKLSNIKEEKLSFDLNGYAPGIYFVTVQSEGRRSTKRIILAD